MSRYSIAHMTHIRIKSAPPTNLSIAMAVVSHTFYGVNSTTPSTVEGTDRNSQAGAIQLPYVASVSLD